MSKTIKLFLPTENPDELIIATVDNWTGTGIRMPRSRIIDSNRPELNKPGVYFLFCGENENNGFEDVYIGESGQDTIAGRLSTHVRDYKNGKEKFYWHTVVFYVADFLDKAKTWYLEHELVKVARKSGRYNILTQRTNDNALHDESDISSMNTFIEYIRLTIGPLGYSRILSNGNCFDNLNNNYSNNTLANNDLFYCKTKDTDAKGCISNGGFIVFAGSKVGNIKESFYKHHTYKLRLTLETKQIITDGTFQKDYEFASPSQASSVCTGRSSNGNVDWRLANGTFLKDAIKQ